MTLCSATTREIWVLEVSGVINPVAASYIRSNLEKAQEKEIVALVIQMDTPGGLATSMRTIIKEILNSSVPVVIYVSPRGAQAASAGVFIAYAAHFTAMAPGTNIGAAHPVNLGGGVGGQMDSTSSKAMLEKVTNDAVALIKTLAEQRGRNVKWAEKAVRESVSITETEAVKLKVVDAVAKNLDDLLALLDGKSFKTPEGERQISLNQVKVKTIPMGVHRRILDIISDPTVAYILLILGFYGLYFEFSSPGAVLPGVLGGIFLILAFFAFQVLPINYAGLALIIVGIILFILEVKIVSYGLLTIGGIIAMTLGSMMLIDVSQAPATLRAISLKVIIPVVLFTAGFIIVALRYVIRAHKQKPTTGKEGLVSEIGKVIRAVSPSGGMVQVRGEYWQATSDQLLPEGTSVEVIEVHGLRLKVKPINNQTIERS
jgi:membrane-bound serine protease (ClpP class)